MIGSGGFRGGVRGVRPPPPLKFAKHISGGFRGGVRGVRPP